jgi:hypothetical protein
MVNQLDFKKLINIDGIVYRLQKIENWDSGKDQTTNVELIRIIKGEGLVSFDIELPFDPFEKKPRGTEGTFTSGAQTRITENNITRTIE